MARMERREYLAYVGAASGVAAATAAVEGTDSNRHRGKSNGASNGGPPDEVPSPTSLRAEYEPSPVGLETQRPRLSWVVDPGVRGQSQRAYRVLVASSEDRLTPGRADKWDSGRVESGESIQVEYEGDSLEPGERVHWAVRIWADRGRPSPWSEPATWEMGLLDEGNWEADWIGPQTSTDHDRLRQWPFQKLDWTDYTVEAEFTVLRERFGLVFRARDSYNFYLAEVGVGESPVTFRLRVREEGQWRTLSETPITYAIPPGTEWDSHTIGVQVRQFEQRNAAGEAMESQITTTIDGVVVDETVDGTRPFGRIGLWVGDHGRAVVEDLSATRPDGSTLFADDFSAPEETSISYADGTIENGHLGLYGTGITLVHAFEPAVIPDPLLRTEVSFAKKIRDARAFVAGLGQYELYVNGERVGDRVLDPDRSDYAETVRYAVRDVTEHLDRGPNAIGIALGRGRYGDPLSTIWDWNDAPWWSDPKLRFQLEVEFVDGTTTTVVSDDTWRVTDGPTRYDSLMGGEVYDARRERSGWTTPGYDDGEWDAVRRVEGPDGELVAQKVRPCTVVDEIDPVEMTEPKPGVYVFDVGQQISGWTELTVEGDAGADVKLTMGEDLDDDETVDRVTGVNTARDITEFNEQLEEDGTVDEVSNIIYPGAIQVDRYILRGEGTETWEPRFSYKGFRYVQVEGEGVPDQPTLDLLTAKVVHNPVERDVDSGFTCSNTLLNKIHENCQWALLNNLQNVSTDTPTFEKAGWIGDNHLIAKAGFHNFWRPRQHLKHMRDIRDAQVTDPDFTWLLGPPGVGNIPVFVPTPNWGYFPGPNPALKSPYILLPWDLYEYFGDTRVIEEYYEDMKKLHTLMESYEENHIIDNGLGDWAAPWLGATPGVNLGEDAGQSPRGEAQLSPQPPEGPAIVSTAYYYRHVTRLAEMASLLDRPDEAADFESLAADIRSSFNDEFLYPDDVYRANQPRGQEQVHTQPAGQYRQTSNVFPLAWDMVPEDRKEGVVRNLVEDVMVTHDGHLNTGVQGTQHILPVLTEHGYHDVAYTVATQITYPSWGYEILDGDLTALAEWWAYNAARSLDHRFFATIEEWFYRHLLGIRPAAPGFAHVEIAPRPPSDLRRVEGRTETIRGVVGVRWEQDDVGNELGMTVDVPGNTTATVRVPTLGHEAVRVRERGRDIWRNGRASDDLPPGISAVERADDAVVVDLGGGRYTFEMTPAGDRPGGPPNDERSTASGTQASGEDNGVGDDPLPLDDGV